MDAQANAVMPKMARDTAQYSLQKSGHGLLEELFLLEHIYI